MKFFFIQMRLVLFEILPVFGPHGERMLFHDFFRQHDLTAPPLTLEIILVDKERRCVGRGSGNNRIIQVLSFKRKIIVVGAGHDIEGTRNAVIVFQFQKTAGINGSIGGIIEYPRPGAGGNSLLTGHVSSLKGKIKK